MGCGKSKHEDVASGNTTVLQRKKSSVSFKTAQENIETETQDNNVDNNVSSVVEVEQKESESVKEFGVEGNKDDDVKGEAEKTNVQEKEVADAAAAAEGNTKEAEKDDSLIESDQKINDAAEEEKLAENKEDVNVEQEETLAKEDEDTIKDTNVSTTEGEQEELKAEEGQGQ